MPEPHKTVYVNCLGVFVFDKQYKLIDKEMFDTATALEFLKTCKIPQTKKIKSYSNAKLIGSGEIPVPEILEELRNEEFFEQFRKINLLL